MNQPNDIPTPRTTAEVNLITGQQGVDWHFSGHKMAQLARTLERELIQLTKERDEFQKACLRAKKWMEVDALAGCDCFHSEHCSYCTKATATLSQLNTVLKGVEDDE